MSRDWHEWYREYDDPTSSLSARLAVVRSQLAALLAAAPGPLRLVGLCAGDGRDTLPVIAQLVAHSAIDVRAVLVELDPALADEARRSAAFALRRSRLRRARLRPPGGTVVPGRRAPLAGSARAVPGGRTDVHLRPAR